MNDYRRWAAMFFCIVIIFVTACSNSSSIQDDTVKGGTLSGRIVDKNGTGVPNVTITVKGLDKSFTVTTDSSGNYSISLFSGGSYILTPVFGEGLFEPVTRSVELSGTDISSLSFTLNSSQIMFDPASLTISGAGESGVANITVRYIRKLISAQLAFSFDPAVLEVTGVVTSGDGFLFTDDGVAVIELIKTIDNENGQVMVSIGGLKGNFTGVSGSGTLVSVTLKGKKAGTSALEFIAENPDDLILAQYVEGSAAGVEPALFFKTDASVTVK